VALMDIFIFLSSSISLKGKYKYIRFDVSNLLAYDTGLQRYIAEISPIMTNGQVKEQVIAMGLIIGQSDSKHRLGSVLRLARQLIGTQKVAAFHAS
jgi:hypothetical protein